MEEDKILSGKLVSTNIKDELKEEVDKLKEKGIIPKLAVIMVGDNPASKVYVKNKSFACQKVGIDFEEFFIVGPFYYSVKEFNGEQRLFAKCLDDDEIINKFEVENEDEVELLELCYHIDEYPIKTINDICKSF